MANKIADIVKQALSERGQPTKRRRPSTKKPPDRKKPRASGKPKTMPATLEASQEFVEQFAEAYVQTGFNGRAAMLKLKPHLKVGPAAVQACRLKNSPSFAKALYRAMARVRSKLEADTNGVIRAWESQAKANIMDYLECVEDAEVGYRLKLKDLNALPAEVLQNIKRIRVKTTSTVRGDETVYFQEVELALVDAQAALNSLARSAGMFSDAELEDLGTSVADLLRKRIAALPTPVRNRLPITFDEQGNILGRK